MKILFITWAWAIPLIVLVTHIFKPSTPVVFSLALLLGLFGSSITKKLCNVLRGKKKILKQAVIVLGLIAVICAYADKWAAACIFIVPLVIYVLFVFVRDVRKEK